jgi:hypothetical protein
VEVVPFDTNDFLVHKVLLVQRGIYMLGSCTLELAADARWASPAGAPLKVTAPPAAHQPVFVGKGQNLEVRQAHLPRQREQVGPMQNTRPFEQVDS